MAQSAVVWCNDVQSLAKLAAVVASLEEMGPYARPCASIAYEVTVSVDVEFGLLVAALAFGFEDFDRQGFLEQLDRVTCDVMFFSFYQGDPILEELCGYFVVPSGSYAVLNLFCAVGAEAFDGE